MAVLHQRDGLDGHRRERRERAAEPEREQRPCVLHGQPPPRREREEAPEHERAGEIDRERRTREAVGRDVDDAAHAVAGERAERAADAMQPSTPGCRRRSSTGFASTGSGVRRARGSRSIAAYSCAHARAAVVAAFLAASIAPRPTFSMYGIRPGCRAKYRAIAAPFGRAVGVGELDHLLVAVLGAVADRAHRRPRHAARRAHRGDRSGLHVDRDHAFGDQSSRAGRDRR